MKAGWRGIGRVLLMLFLLAGVLGCPKSKITPQSGMGPGSDLGGPGAGGGGRGPLSGLDEARWRELGINSDAEKREFLQQAESFENTDVYFDYDSYVLTEPAKKILDDKIRFLKRYAAVKVTVEGHCDERGTNEYNVALGERRANSAQQYIANSGLTQAKPGSVSYGEERPLATGHDEASWAKNRRAHFVVSY